MYLNKILNFKCKDKDFFYRTISYHDINDRYIRTLQGDLEYIENASNVTLSSQETYINNIWHSKFNLLCGLFIDDDLVATTGIKLCGNFATIGVLVFDGCRGGGIGKLIIWSACYYCKYFLAVENFLAGANVKNIASVKSFEACGFNLKIYSDIIQMRLNFSSLLMPKEILSIKVHDYVYDK